MYGYGYRYNSGLVVGAGGGAPFLNTYSTQFDGVDDYIVATPTGLGITDAITISAWVKTPINWGGGPNPRIGTVIAEDNIDGNSNWVLYYRGGGIDTFGVQIWNTNGDLNVLYSSVLGANDGNWHHIVATYDGTSNTNALKIYIDNVVTEGTTTGTGVQNFNRATVIGGSRYKPPLAVLRYFRDYIDEVAVWDSELTATQISNIYNNGKPNDLTNTNPLVWYRMGDNGSYKSPQWLLPSNENKDKVSNYSFDFDGVDDKIELGAQSLGITGAISVSAWVKIPTTNTGGGGTNIQNIVCEDRTSGTNRNWTLYWRGGGLNQITGVIWDSAGSAVAATTTAIVPNDGIWHHVMFTYTGDTSTDGLKLFVDGIQRAQGTSANGGTRATTAVVPTIGGLSQSITWMFEGNIDEVSVFNSDQSANIATLYNNGTPTTIPSGAVAHYKMGEEATFSGGVWTVPDSVGSNNGTSNAMTIEDRVGDAPNSDNNALSYNMDEVDRVTDTP